jgi:phospholipid/cholesterol/gamma-HCH transport system substrate-binding protein
MTTRLRANRMLTLVTAVLVAVLAITAVVVVVNLNSGKTITAYFSQTPGLYVGDDVRVLGIKVGSIDAITPQPGRVRVDMHYDADRPVPANARAAVVAATLVSGRYVQLAPVYRGGPQLPDGGTIPESRTVVPVEWDQVKDQLARLSTDLGPNAESDPQGALNRLLQVGAANLQGNGKTLHDTIAQVSRAVTTISDGRQDLFATVRNLQVTVSALAAIDPQVDRFNRQLADVSQILDDNRTDLATAIQTFDRATPVIQQFVAQNRDQLSGRLAELQRVSQNLSDNRQELGNLLQKAPTAFDNLHNIYDPVTGTLTGALALNQFGNPAQFLCSAVFGAGNPTGTIDTTSPQGKQALNVCRQGLGGLGQVLQQNNVPLQVPSIIGQRPGAPQGGN